MPFLAQLMLVSISEERAKGYFSQLTSALAYLHENGVSKFTPAEASIRQETDLTSFL